MEVSFCSSYRENRCVIGFVNQWAEELDLFCHQCLFLHKVIFESFGSLDNLFPEFIGSCGNMTGVTAVDFAIEFER